MISVSREELYDFYIVKRNRISDVAEKYGIKTYWARKLLIENGIDIRKKGNGIKVYPELELTQQKKEFFDGLIISDGSICRRKKIKPRRSRGNDFLSCGFKHKEFAEYIVNYLDLGVEVKEYYHVSDRYKSGRCKQYKFLSKANVYFTKERDRWYPKDKKIIPDDFIFSPISMNIMYLCDGYLGRNYICLYTMSFEYSNIHDIIINKIINNITSKCYIGKNNIIVIRDTGVRNFLDYIGDCPVSCYKYKWNTK